MKAKDNAEEAGDHHNDEFGDSDEFWRQYKSNAFFFSKKGAAGNPLAGKWQRAQKDMEFGKGYALANEQGDTAMKEFRQRWAEGRFKKYTRRKEVKNSRRQEFFQTGK